MMPLQVEEKEKKRKLHPTCIPFLQPVVCDKNLNAFEKRTENEKRRSFVIFGYRNRIGFIFLCDNFRIEFEGMDFGITFISNAIHNSD